MAISDLSKDFFFGYRMPLFHILLAMSHRGVRIDRDQLAVFKEQIGEATEKAAIHFYFASGGVEVTSNKQLCELFYEKMKLPKQYQMKTGNVTVEKEALEKLWKLSKHHPLVKAVQDYREAADNVILRLKLDADGRLRTHYSMTTADTGRLSSKKTLDKTGANLQNVEEKYRVMVIPDEGLVLFGGDLAQAEARLTAYDAEELEMIQIFEEGRNIHKASAALIFHLKEEEVAKSNDPKSPYGKAKRCNHAFDYCLGFKHAAELIGCSQAEAKAYKNAYFKRFPKILAWQENIRQRACVDRRIITPLGRFRIFFGRNDEDLVRKMIAHGPQSSCVDYLNQGLVRMVPKLRQPRAELLLQTHDGYVGQCRPEDLEEIHALAKQAVEVPIVNHGREFKIPLETSSGMNWRDMK